MAEITALFWDIGGVVLTDGWDEAERRLAADTFGLDWDDFQQRHKHITAQLETGQIDLDAYLDATIFWRPRSFSKDEVRTFMFAQSAPHPEVVAIVAAIARSRQFLMATLNNESAELNAYRITTFGLRSYFSAFFSSCYLGVMKPDPSIYHRALQITQRSPEECLMIDDRVANLEAAARLGMQTLHCQNATQLAEDLAGFGIVTG